jgi:hypothetical protein
VPFEPFDGTDAEIETDALLLDTILVDVAIRGSSALV